MINRAVRLAQKSTHKTHRHATLIVSGGRLIGAGYNHGSIHSEIAAIRSIRINSDYRNIAQCAKELGSKLKNSTFINIMLTRAGNFGNSFPCDECLKELRAMGVRKVTFYYNTVWDTMAL